MIRWKRAAGLGLLSWLVPFGISFVAFPVKQSNAQLFGTMMGLVVLAAAGVLLARLFRDRAVGLGEALPVTIPHQDSGIGPAHLVFSTFARFSARMVKA
jgi:Tfp pilus assembly protein PilN